MPDERIVLVMTIAAAASLGCTRLMLRIAPYIGLVDAPDGFRKLHRGTTPLGGGVAVYLGVAAAVALSLLLHLGWTDRIWQDSGFFLSYILGATVICGLGVIDDIVQLRGRQKFLGQLVAVSIMALGGLQIEAIEVLGYRLELGLMAIPFTLFWLLGAVNALNLIDGVDGLATTVGVILSVTISVLAFITGHPVEAHLAAIFAASLTGFLVFNWPPARIFLGDAGSMLIGLTLGVLAIRASLKGAATAALVAPTVLWAIPIFDVAMAILRRKLTGQSVYATDRGHLHHVLQQNGLGSLGVVLSIGGLCAICGIAAMVAVIFESELTAVITAMALLATIVVTRLFGHSECKLLLLRTHGFFSSMLRMQSSTAVPHPIQHQFHGTREWDQLCDQLSSTAQRCGLSFIQVNINAPMIGERFHTEWRRPGTVREGQEWRAEIPLRVDNQVIGKITVTGILPAEAYSFRTVSEVMSDLEVMEREILDLLQDDFAELPADAVGSLGATAVP